MFWRIIIGIALNLLAAVFLKPKGPRPATLEAFNIPRADEGSKVFDLAGTAWRKDPHIVWYGDFYTRGGDNDSNTYYVGLHLVLCRQIDFLLDIRLSEKEAWTGRLGGGQSSRINKNRLFGGERSEGGFRGNFHLLDGNPSQGINTYLAGVLGELTPAYRGVVSLIFERPYVSANSARLPSMKMKVFNVEGIHRGWEPDKALVGVSMSGGGAAVYIAMDTSTSISIGNRFATQKAALAGFVRSLKGAVGSVRVVAFSNSINGTIERLDCTDDDYEDVALWIEAFTTISGGTSFSQAVASAPAFFEADEALIRDLTPATLVGAIVGSESETRRKVVIFSTDGEATGGSETAAVATLATIPGVEVYAFNIDLTDTSYTELIDNTPGDGVPVVTGEDPGELSVALSSALLSWADVNPAHIIRCLWTDPMRGGVAQDSEIGDSFAAAADQLLAEGFGLSVPFRGADLVESDRLEVERHIDAVSYRSRRTGKIELKLIRNDYVIDDLPILDSSIVMEWSGLERSNRGELANQLTVIYTKRENGETASVTRTNVAGVRRAGRVIPGDPVEYPFITTARLATRVCLRDLSVQDRPLLAGTLRLAYLPPELEIGEPFVVHEPLLGIYNVVLRILDSREGNGRDNSVTVQVSEDRYTLPSEGVVGDDVDTPTPVVNRAQPSPVRVAQEAPYYMMARSLGAATVNAKLTATPGLGLMLATGTRATAGHQNITVAVDSGAGYVSTGDVAFAASVLTLTALTSEADDVVVTVPSNLDLETITANSLALIGTELVRIDAFTVAGANIDITLGRGVLDTVPVAHAIGARIIFLQGVNPLSAEYADADTADVKLLTNLPSNTLSLAAAPVDAITFDSRPIRPYPPGRFKVNGSYEQGRTVTTAVLTWVHRDRLTQIGAVPADHDDAGIGPEASTTYQVRAEALDDSGAVLSTVTDVNVGALLTYTWTPGTLPGGTASVRLSVASVRGGYESWQRPSIDLSLFLPPGSLDFEVII